MPLRSMSALLGPENAFSLTERESERVEEEAAHTSGAGSGVVEASQHRGASIHDVTAGKNVRASLHRALVVGVTVITITIDTASEFRHV